jgi:hypothetical protein
MGAAFCSRQKSTGSRENPFTKSQAHSVSRLRQHSARMDSPAPQVPQCPSCRHNEPAGFYLAGRYTVEPRCVRYVISFPDALRCPYYEREPGAD